jgi:hypothetical protein
MHVKNQDKLAMKPINIKFWFGGVFNPTNPMECVGANFANLWNLLPTN